MYTLVRFPNAQALVFWGMGMCPMLCSMKPGSCAVNVSSVLPVGACCYRLVRGCCRLEPVFCQKEPNASRGDPRKKIVARRKQFSQFQLYIVLKENNVNLKADAIINFQNTCDLCKLPIECGLYFCKSDCSYASMAGTFASVSVTYAGVAGSFAKVTAIYVLCKCDRYLFKQSVPMEVWAVQFVVLNMDIFFEDLIEVGLTYQPPKQKVLYANISFICVVDKSKINVS